MKLFRGGKILVSVLDWGLGHASRTSAVVRVLVARGCRVVLAGSGRSLALLRADFPDLESVEVTSFSPTLSSGRVQWLKIGVQVPVFLWRIFTERRAVERIVREKDIDCVVSDNRYGFRSGRCPSFIITHQLNIRIASGAPQWANAVVTWGVGLFLRKFDSVLVPDVRLGGLSGALSWPVGRGLRTHCIGVLSRMADVEAEETEGVIEWLGVTSGAEPQRGIFAQTLIKRFAGYEGRRVVVCGLAGGGEAPRAEGGVEVVDYADASRLKGLLLAARHIVCRSGYSTIMDLEALGLEAEFVATPGQAEQEYLAERMAMRKDEMSGECGDLPN